METRKSLIGRIAQADPVFSADAERVTAVLPFDIPVQGNGRTDGAIAFVSGAGDKAEGGYMLVCPDICRDADGFFRVPVSDIKEIKFGEGVGCVMLEYTDAQDKPHMICRASMQYAELYSNALRRINAWLRGREYDGGYEESAERCCPKCGRPYINGSSICPSCVDKGQYLKRLWQLAKPCHGYIFLSILLYFVIAAVDLVGPMISRIITDDYINADSLPRMTGYIVAIGMMFAVSLVSRLFGVIRSIAVAKASNRVIVDLRGEVFRRISGLSISHMGKRTVGDLMSRIMGDTGNLRNFLVNDLGSAIEMLVTFVGVCIFLFAYDPIIAIAVIVPIPLVYWLNGRFRKTIMPRWHRRWVLTSRTNTIMHDIFSGIRVVKAYGREHEECKRYDKAIKQECDVTKKTEVILSIMMPVLNFIIGIGEFFTIYYVGKHVLNGSMTLGYMQQITTYIGLIYTPLFWFSGIMRKMVTTMTSIAKIYEIIDEKSDVQESEEAVSFPIKGHITIEGIDFGYGKADNVLENVSLEIKPGEMIGIVGRSGVGKTTLINLIMRLYDVEGGRILIDGVDIRDISGHSLRSQIGAVLQETFLFTGTVYDNIIYSKPDATHEEVIAAARLAGAHDFIMRMPDGYNTLIGEKGLTVSGGERQRISIARALLHDPKILILDEATSALDTETERHIQSSIASLTAGRTTIAIAHRLSTLRGATRLVVLDKGTVAEVGSHDELMQKKGIYYGLVMAQRQMNRIKK